MTKIRQQGDELLVSITKPAKKAGWKHSDRLVWDFDDEGRMVLINMDQKSRKLRWEK